MAAPTKPCDVKILLANSEPSTHEQFAVDPRCTPQWVGKAHVTDQLAYLRRHLRPSPADSRFPAPIGSEPCPGPTDHGIRLDDRQRAPNIGEQSIEADQYQSVDAAEEKPLWRAPPQDIDLLAQHQDLRLKLCSRSEQVAEPPPELGIDVGRTSVAKYMAQLGDPARKAAVQNNEGPGAPEP